MARHKRMPRDHLRHVDWTDFTVSRARAQSGCAPPCQRLDATRGVGGVLLAAHYRDNIANRVALLAAIAAGIALFAAARWSLTEFGHVPILIVQLVCWAFWLSWLGWCLPRLRLRLLTQMPRLAYRRVLTRQLIPCFVVISGICAAPAQLSALEFVGSGGDAADLGFSTVGEILGAATLFGVGLGMQIWAFTTIGLPAGSYVNEFAPLLQPLSVKGIYRYVRHPIALGGVLSPGAFALHGGLPLCLWLINIAMLIPYGMVEDRRLRTVFGQMNDTYMDSVRQFIPVPRWYRRHRPPL